MKGRFVAIKKFILVSMVLMFAFIVPTVKADDSNMHSLVGDYFNKVFDVEPGTGHAVTDTYDDDAKREEINNQIFDGTVSKTYSLYDRFGGNVHFVPYFGETKITTGLADRFYNEWLQNKGEFKLTLSDIHMLFEMPAISNNSVYKNRPDVLANSAIQSGQVDPRVSAYVGVNPLGGEASIGNVMLDVSNFVSNLVGWLSGSGLFSTINSIFNEACKGGLKNVLKVLSNIFLPLAVAGFVLLMLKNAFRVVSGKLALKPLLLNVVSGLISLALVYALLANPMLFSSVSTHVVSLLDTTFDKAVETGQNEVVVSDNVDHVRQASLWKVAIFEPWCNGMFGKNYEQLYTQFDTGKNHTKMDQSHDNVKEVWSGGAVRYDSADLTGDVVVQIGKNNYVRNWAALAWSTQSIYHINAVKDDGKGVGAVWPHANTAPMNSNIYLDDFRVLDAKLNISPEYRSPSDVTMSYSNSKPYTVDFVGQGLNALLLAALLIPIAILSVRKVYYAIRIVVSGMLLLLHSVENLVLPERYSILNNLKSLVKPVYDYLWWDIMIFVAVSVYITLAGKSPLANIIWLIIGIMLCMMKPIRTPQQVAQVAYSIKSHVKNVANKVKRH
jgi:hypothetical protein